MAVQVDKNEVIFEIGRMAHNADGAAVVRVGNLAVLGTAVHKRIEAFYKGRMPLTVDYRERAVAAGKMAGSLSRRETNFTDVELRTAGLCHRALASALDTRATHDTQVGRSAHCEANRGPKAPEVVLVIVAESIVEVPRILTLTKYDLPWHTIILIHYISFCAPGSPHSPLCRW